MKRSEALKEIPEGVPVLWWEAVMKYVEERLGVTWDPEDEPFPERLKVSQFGDLQYEDGPIMLTIRDKREVVRRWNAFPRLRRLADAPNEFVPVISARSFQNLLLAILDGKETP